MADCTYGFGAIRFASDSNKLKEGGTSDLAGVKGQDVKKIDRDWPNTWVLVSRFYNLPTWGNWCALLLGGAIEWIEFISLRNQLWSHLWPECKIFSFSDYGKGVKKQRFHKKFTSTFTLAGCNTKDKKKNWKCVLCHESLFYLKPLSGVQLHFWF